MAYVCTVFLSSIPQPGYKCPYILDHMCGHAIILYVWVGGSKEIRIRNVHICRILIYNFFAMYVHSCTLCVYVVQHTFQIDDTVCNVRTLQVLYIQYNIRDSTWLLCHSPLSTGQVGQEMGGDLHLCHRTSRAPPDQDERRNKTATTRTVLSNGEQIALCVNSVFQLYSIVIVLYAM